MDSEAYVRAKATSFGWNYARQTFGRGFTKIYLYGVVVGAGPGSNQKVKWEDGETTEHGVKHLEESNQEAYDAAISARELTDEHDDEAGKR